MQRLSQPRVGTDPSVKGLNFFDATEQTLLRTLQHGEFNIHGWRRADLLAHLHITPSAMSRQLKRLRLLGLIKKVAHTYRYYLTRMGRAAIAAACSLTRFNIVPAMAAAALNSSHDLSRLELLVTNLNEANVTFSGCEFEGVPWWVENHLRKRRHLQ